VRRLYNRLYAHLNGYFWLPCRGCGRMFGGHEPKGGTLWTSDSGGWVLCEKCPDDIVPDGITPITHIYEETS